MAFVDRLSSPFPLENRGSKTENSGKDHSLNYLVGFAAFGLFFSTVSTALTPPEWLPEPLALDYGGRVKWSLAAVPISEHVSSLSVVRGVIRDRQARGEFHFCNAQPAGDDVREIGGSGAFENFIYVNCGSPIHLG
jgi:hypothetical protein